MLSAEESKLEDRQNEGETPDFFLLFSLERIEHKAKGL